MYDVNRDKTVFNEERKRISMKKMHFVIIGLLIIGFTTGCSQNDETNTNQEEKVIPIEVVEATEEDLVIEKSLYGRTAPKRTTPIVVQMPGEIDELKVENGDQVEEGDIIATLKTQAGTQNVGAPRKGEVIQLEQEEGDCATESEPLAMIIDLTEIKLDFTVTSHLRSLLEKDAELTTIINDEEYTAEITMIGTMPGETGLYPIEAKVNNEDEQILPGMVTVMQVPEKRIKKALILPTEAIIEESDETYVYIVQDDTVVKTDITILETQSDKTAVEGEIEVDDQIVINGQLTLEDGSKVNVVKEGNQS